MKREKNRRRQITWGKRLGALLLALVMVVGLLPLTNRPVQAATDDGRPITDPIADPDTGKDWEDSFNAENTDQVGRIWTDKSVYTEDFTLDPSNIQITKENADSLLVGLSVMSAAKSIVGQTYKPTDTVLVLDMSASMEAGSVSAMVEAANAAIARLQNLNQNNRVGVVLYGNDATTLLGLGRYSSNNDAYLTASNGTVRVGNGVQIDGEGDINRTAVRNNGSTHTQLGLAAALRQFQAADTIVEDGVQAGADRMPVLVLMSDGEPTYARADFSGFTGQNVGPGVPSRNENFATLGFLTELSAAYVKAEMDTHYAGEAPLVYTLGVGLDGASNPNVAQDVLHPGGNASYTTISGYWTRYFNLGIGQSMSLRVPSRWGQGSSVTITRNDTIDSIQQRDYVDSYFAANDADDMIAAFDDIVEQIIIQSIYYPTEAGSDKNLDGYVTITDDLGDYMEVQNVVGLVNHDRLYTADTFLRNLSGQETEFVESVSDRLGIAADEAEELITAARSAGQISSTSNYIAWYADADENYLGFCNDPEDLEAAKAADAAYIICSYLYAGESKGTAGDNEEHIGDGGADLMYISARVCTDVTTRQQHVTFKVPASLIPMQQYDVEINGDDLTAVDTATVTRTPAYPMRFYYEAGLRSDVNELNVAEIVGGDPADGVYTFYSNAWQDNGETVAEYYPSEDNEFYYFTADTFLVDENGGYITGSTLPASNLYYNRYLFAPTGGWLDNTEQTVAVREVRNWPIGVNNTAIRSAAQQDEEGRWYIPKGTPKTGIIRENYTAQKSDNRTQTKPEALVPDIETDAYGNVHVLVTLGNNGLLKIQQEQGIAIHKVLAGDVPQENQKDDFTFQVTLANAGSAASFALIKEDANGNLTRSTVAYDAASGKLADITLKNGETAYITGLPTGTAYTVTETGHANFYLASVTDQAGNPPADGTLVASGTVKDHVIDWWEFENRYQTTAELRVKKEIHHDLGSSFTPNPNQAFEFTLELVMNAGSQQVPSFDATVTSSGGVTTQQPISMTYVEENGAITGTGTFALKDGEEIRIQNLPAGANYTVTETLVDHYTASADGNGTNTIGGSISDTVMQGHTFVNTYSADPASSSVLANLEVQKRLTGRDWLPTDSFTFILEQRLGVNRYTELGRLTLAPEAVEPPEELSTEPTEAPTTEPTDAPATEPTNETTEPTETTEATEATESTETTGTPEVTTETTALVTDETATETVQTLAAVTNSGAAETSEETSEATTVETTVAPSDETTTVSPSNQEDDTEPTTPPEAGTPSEPKQKLPAEQPEYLNGVFAYFSTASYSKTGDYQYRIREAASGIGGMTDDTTVWRVLVRVRDANYDGQLEATVYISDTLSWEDLGASNPADTAVAEFENVYAPTESGTMTLNVQKSVRNETGVDLGGLAGYQFGVYSEDDALQATITTNGDGAASFTTSFGPEYAGESMRYYVQEIIPANPIPGMAYDQAKYFFTVNVVDNQLGGVDVVWSWDATGDNAPLEVENVYTVQPAAHTLSGTKTLTGRSLKDGEFQFSIIQTDENHNALTGGFQQTVSNIGSSFQFDLSLATAGTHYFTVTEGNNQLGGVDYDDTAYYYTVEVALKDGTDALEVAEATLTKRVADGEPIAADQVTFANTYTAQPTSLYLTGEKTLTGRDWLDSDSFEFLLEAQNADGAWSTLDTAAVTGSGQEKTFSFSGIPLEKVGDYSFRVREVIPEEPLANMTYDDTVYTIQVHVTDNEQGSLVVDSVLVNGTAFAAETDRLSFENTYTQPEIPPTEPPTEPATEPPTEPPTKPVDPESPNTGDETPLALLFSLLFVAAAGIVVLAVVFMKGWKKSR